LAPIRSPRDQVWRRDPDHQDLAGPGAANGISYAASFRDGDSGSDCPKGALYLATGQGLTAGGTIVVWEA
jgi:hypothetical protein